jgi:hypothetical protein
MPRQLEEGWQGSPSTYKQITFSATANRHVVNTQYVPKYVPEMVPVPRARPGDAPFLGREASKTTDRKRRRRRRRKGNTENHRNKSSWVGSPSTNALLSFSASANKHIINTQSIPGMGVGGKLAQEGGQRNKSRQLRSTLTHVAINNGWVGSPSTDKRITFSSTANKHVVQTQQVPDILDQGSINQVRHRQINVEGADRANEERGWVGSPSTFKKITYSSTTNRHITNTQYIPEFVHEIIPPPKTHADAWDEPLFLGRTNPSPTGKSKPRRERARGEPSKHHTQPTRRRKDEREKMNRREANWVGSPSTYKDITFSSTSNRHIVNTQDLPKFVM